MLKPNLATRPIRFEPRPARKPRVRFAKVDYENCCEICWEQFRQACRDEGIPEPKPTQDVVRVPLSFDARCPHSSPNAPSILIPARS
jgi:hypothetical protein